LAVSPASLAGLFARNWRLKLAALGLSVFLWALVRVEGPAPSAVTVPVRVQLNDPGWMLVGDPVPSVVDVRFSGPVREIFRLGMDGTSFTIPVNEVQEQDLVVALQERWIPIQKYSGVQVEEIIPRTVHLHVEQIRTSVLPVRISTRGQIPDGLAMTRAMGLTPDVVRVSGPESLVGQLDTLDIVPADLGLVDLDGALEAMVDTAGYSDLTVIPTRVTLRVPVEESMDRVLSGIPIESVASIDGSAFEVLPATVELVLRGARTRVSAVDPARLRVFIPPYALQGLGSSEERRVPVVVEGVPSFVSASVTTDSVTVRRSEP
jgi:YbbR-like protein